MQELRRRHLHAAIWIIQNAKSDFQIVVADIAQPSNLKIAGSPLHLEKQQTHSKQYGRDVAS